MFFYATYASQGTGIWGEKSRDMGKSTGIWGEKSRDMGKSTGIWGRVPQNKGEVFLVDILHF